MILFLYHICIYEQERDFWWWKRRCNCDNCYVFHEWMVNALLHLYWYRSSRYQMTCLHFDTWKDVFIIWALLNFQNSNAPIDSLSLSVLDHDLCCIERRKHIEKYIVFWNNLFEDWENTSFWLAVLPVMKQNEVECQVILHR
jgi:hypothetical protein